MAVRHAEFENGLTTPELFADDLAERARCALTEQAARREIFSVGHVPFELTAPRETDDDWLGRAFAPLGQPAAQIVGAAHRLSAWDNANTKSAPPPRPWGPSDHEPLGVVNGFSNEAVRCAFDVHTSSLIAYDFRVDRSFNWFPNISALPAWAKASPFRITLSWLLNRNGMQIVHGAALSIENRAVLLAGAGGIGKSTTALACALAGTGYLGDDYCAIEPLAGKVHMIYRTAKVLPATLAMLPALKPWLVNRDRVEFEKGVIFLEASDVELVHSAMLSAILLPRRAIERCTRIVPASRAEAIAAILPSTIGGLMGGTAMTPKAIMQLVHSVPAYHLELGSDLNAVASAVAGHLTTD